MVPATDRYRKRRFSCDTLRRPEIEGQSREELRPIRLAASDFAVWASLRATRHWRPHTFPSAEAMNPSTRARELQSDAYPNFPARAGSGSHVARQETYHDELPSARGVRCTA